MGAPFSLYFLFTLVVCIFVCFPPLIPIIITAATLASGSTRYTGIESALHHRPPDEVSWSGLKLRNGVLNARIIDPSRRSFGAARRGNQGVEHYAGNQNKTRVNRKRSVPRVRFWGCGVRGVYILLILWCTFWATLPPIYQERECYEPLRWRLVYVSSIRRLTTMDQFWNYGEVLSLW